MPVRWRGAEKAGRRETGQCGQGLGAPPVGGPAGRRQGGVAGAGTGQAAKRVSGGGAVSVWNTAIER